MVIDVGFVGFEGFVFEGSVEIFDGFLELFVPVEGEASLVKYFRVCWLTGERIGEVLNGFGIVSDIDVNVTSLHQKLLVLWLSLKCFVQIVKSFLVVFHQTVSLPYALEDARVL